MEQQSVSISKAGINTTLNARCAVLGAANPVKGRYDLRQSVEHNVGLPCSLLSRFDILVILRDESDEERDKALAQHVTSLHQNEEIENINYREIRNYIEQCKTFDPSIPNELSGKLLEFYIKTRKNNEYTTPRFLLSLIRLCLAHARLRQSNLVSEEDVNEVLRLMEVMKVPSIKKKNDTMFNKRKIYEKIMSLVNKKENNESFVKLEDIWRETQGLYTRHEVEDVISSFCSTGTWVRTENDEIKIFE
jgi:DNA replication licensing factor MCM7